ncbi:MAG TPA: TetR/AcrR family transcriptional regulator [Candidatus Binataceae bacterium]|nr:TetR/AcrR family transcriptional regulator [Candidatus Binataceae bacterium]
MPANGRPGSKRERILQAGLRLFAQQPYQAVTMDHVAQAAGVAKGTLYLYFQSKEDLYLGILNDGLDAVANRYQSGADATATFRERVRRVIGMTIEFYDQNRDLLRLIATEEPRLAQARNRVLQGWRDRGRQFIVSQIEGGMRAGEFRPGDPRLVALAIVGGLRNVLLYHDGNRPVSELSHEFGEFVIRAIRACRARTRKAVSVS